jgi:hypothetical protein
VSRTRSGRFSAPGHTGPVYGVAFSPDGRMLATASSTGAGVCHPSPQPRGDGHGPPTGGAGAARDVLAGVRVFKRATSLGGVESLIEHRRDSEGPSSPVPRTCSASPWASRLPRT